MSTGLGRRQLALRVFRAGRSQHLEAILAQRAGEGPEKQDLVIDEQDSWVYHGNLMVLLLLPASCQ